MEQTSLTSTGNVNKEDKNVCPDSFIIAEVTVTYWAMAVFFLELTSIPK